ncbi:MAG: copper resistance protein CopC [Caldimonas sp.]
MRTLVKLVSMFWALIVADSASAHAFLDHAQPPVGSTLHSAPARVELWFSQDLELAFSTLRVVDGAGKQVDERDKSVSDRDKTQMTVSLPPLPPGKYRVYWRVLSVDTHVTEGDFTFELAP